MTNNLRNDLDRNVEASICDPTAILLVMNETDHRLSILYMINRSRVSSLSFQHLRPITLLHLAVCRFLNFWRYSPPRCAKKVTESHHHHHRRQKVNSWSCDKLPQWGCIILSTPRGHGLVDRLDTVTDHNILIDFGQKPFCGVERQVR